MLQSLPVVLGVRVRVVHSSLVVEGLSVAGRATTRARVRSECVVCRTRNAAGALNSGTTNERVGLGVHGTPHTAHGSAKQKIHGLDKLNERIIVDCRELPRRAINAVTHRCTEYVRTTAPGVKPTTRGVDVGHLGKCRVEFGAAADVTPDFLIFVDQALIRPSRRRDKHEGGVRLSRGRHDFIQTCSDINQQNGRCLTNSPRVR